MKEHTPRSEWGEVNIRNAVQVVEYGLALAKAVKGCKRIRTTELEKDSMSAVINALHELLIAVKKEQQEAKVKNESHDAVQTDNSQMDVDQDEEQYDPF